MYGFSILSRVYVLIVLYVKVCLHSVRCYVYVCIQRVPGGMDNILGVIVSVILSKKLYMNMCPIPIGFRDRAI
jgi:hypothetical protein